MCGKSPMGGEFVHSIDWSAVQDKYQVEQVIRLAAAKDRFAELCKSGAVFSRPPTPIRIEDIAYG